VSHTGLELFAVGLVHLAGIGFACHAVVNTRTSQGAIAWAVALVTMPWLTLVPYLFLGRSRFSGYIGARRACNRAMRERVRQPEWESQSAACDDGPDALLGAASTRALTALAGMRFLPGNQVRLLINGEATFDAIIAAIEQARHHVVVQFFIIKDDALGRRLHDALTSKARQGVPVLLLYDSIGSHALSRAFVVSLRAAGVTVHKFATRRFVNRFQLNFRNHRKIVVVDGRRAFVGGHNVGVEYLGAKPPLSPWRDTHIEIEGPAAANVQFIFVEDWYWATRHFPELSWPTHRSGGHMHCQVIASGPADEYETCTMFFVEAINSARSRLWLTSPYFVPDEAVLTALKLAVMRGVDVRLLLPVRPDHRVVFAASTLYAHDAVAAGVRVFRFQPGFMHQKVMLIDDRAAAVGSANLDNRSLRLNFELMVLTADRAFAAQIEQMLVADLEMSREIRRDEVRRAGGMRRVAMQVARLFAPVL
jgi:cardiolipin synthase